MFLASGAYYAYDLTIDSSANLYLIGKTGLNTSLVFKVDSSGTVLWQRYLTNLDPRGIACNAAGDFCVTGQSSSRGAGGTDIIVFRGYRDGSGLGNYGGISYNNYSLAISAGSLTAGTPSQSVTNGTYAGSATSLTEADGSLTVT